MLLLRGDVGGFGIDDASDYTYNVMAAFRYSFSDSMALIVGYRVFGMKYDSGSSGSEQFGFDGIAHGPMIGMNYTFR